MSRFPPEADEAQRRHYNDGHFVNPYDTYDPFNPPVSSYPPQPSFVAIPPPPPPIPQRQSFGVPYSPYSSQSPPPPPPPPGAFAGAYSPSPTPNPSGLGATRPGPSTSPVSPPDQGYPSVRYRPSAQSIYDAQDDHEDDNGDIPLLNRPTSQAGLRIPSQLEEDGDTTLVDDNKSETNVRYGRIPQRVPRRYKTLKRTVELVHGNFVLDNPVPEKLLALSGVNRSDREFGYMRYSAATCDPNDFKVEGFTLRQVLYDPPRRTELFIVMTMYNEDEELFTRSMHGVIRNVAHLCKRDRSKTWGKDGWKKVVVCIVSDGRSKVNQRTLGVIAAMGCYQEGVAKNKIGIKDVTAHIYEYTTQISVTPSLKIETAEKGVVPVQIIFCLKEKNQKKINSHRWFFNAFGPILEPNVCVLLDVGTMPGPTSIYHLWKAFDINSNVGGACGEIVALKGKYGTNLINPLVAAQNFEYKMSNILDKPLESIFGYITVLPGAFSAYRYIAIQNERSGDSGPLYKYFLGEQKHGSGGIFTANMYLAEDRILCWELVSKRGCSWILHYVKSAYGVTDVPDQVPELISQRRRWLNGSFFAAIHSTVHFYYIYRSSHTFIRKFWIHVEMIYQLLNLIFSWFALAHYYIAFAILSTALEDPSFGLKGIHIANVILNYFYLGLLIMCFILALGNRPQGSKWPYTLAMVGFGFITVYMTASALVLAFKGLDALVKENKGALDVKDFFTNSIFRDIVLSLAATLGLYIFASLLFLDPWHMVTSFVQYTVLAPSYINVLNVYAFANVHDISWGTKGDNASPLGSVATTKTGQVDTVVPDVKSMDKLYDEALEVLQTKKPKEEKKVDESQKQDDYYRNIRTNVLLAWVLTNSLLAATITTTNAKASTAGANAAVAGYMTFLLYSVALLAFIRFCGSTGYIIVRLFAGE